MDVCSMCGEEKECPYSNPEYPLRICVECYETHARPTQEYLDPEVKDDD